MPRCVKHPNTELVIRQGKRKQNFVVCPECKPEAASAAAAPVSVPAEKKNEPNKRETAWYDRPIFG